MATAKDTKAERLATELAMAFEQKPIARTGELRRLLETLHARKVVRRSLTLGGFIDSLAESGRLIRTVLQFPSRREVLFHGPDSTPFEIALSVRPGAYLSHFSAMSLHMLTDQLPRAIYVNCEQTPKPKPALAPNQGRIDAAFRRAPRVSSNVASFGEYSICLLSGKHTGRAGVVDLVDESGRTLRVTGIERTLIDAVVRPFYSGGIFSVLEAYRRAVETCSVPRLLQVLRTLDYSYPYHQCVGFLMERAGGYSGEDVSLLEALPRQVDFYLTHQMQSPEYSRRWRLFYPQGL